MIPPSVMIPRKGRLHLPFCRASSADTFGAPEVAAGVTIDNKPDAWCEASHFLASASPAAAAFCIHTCASAESCATPQPFWYSNPM